MVVYEVSDLGDFYAQLKGAGNKVVVVDFTASWCGPCKQISPRFHALADRYSNVMVFLQVDVDAVDEASTELDITCMPTFHFYKNEKKIEQFSGANQEALAAAVKKYADS